MAKRTCLPPKESRQPASKERARIAFDAVVESIHEDHKMLEGKDLWAAVVEVFGITRPSPSNPDKK